MDPNQKKILGIIGAVFGVIVVALAVLLFRQCSATEEAAAGRDEASQSLENCYRVNPYPNTANLKIRQADAKAYADWADRALATLTKSANVLKFRADETPSQFLDRLNSGVRRLNGRQQAEQLALYGINAATLGKRSEGGEAAVTDYSFGRYVTQGEMPAAANVPRLAEQFAAIDFVCTLLYDKGALYISDVTREAFDEVKQEEPAKNTRANRRRRNAREDEKAKAAAAAPGVPELLVKDGVRREIYTIRFQARYRTLVDVLNTLATTTDVFFVIDDISVTSPMDIRARVADRVKKREAALRTARMRAERRGEKVEAEQPDTNEGLFAGATPAERLVSDPDPERSSPLDITLKFEIWTAPAPEVPEAAPAAPEAAEGTQEGV